VKESNQSATCVKQQFILCKHCKGGCCLFGFALFLIRAPLIIHICGTLASFQMSLIKRVADRGVTMAWCPSQENKSLIAAASKEGAGGGFDDVGGLLEIYELDFSSENENMVLRGSAKTSLKFETLAWAKFSAQGQHPAGILAGGMTDGSLSIWDPASMIAASLDGGAASSSQFPLATVQGKHKANVNALAFNPAANMNHILASGSADNSVLLFDLNNPTAGEIAHYAPAEGEVTGHQAPVRAIAWNNEVEYILASAAGDGVTSVWDLRAKRPWCHLRDPSRQPCSAICWNPNTGKTKDPNERDDRDDRDDRDTVTMYCGAHRTALLTTTLSLQVPATSI
jgi:protein transport protein SEC31